jgi:putative aldouronate transport system substrate-binding protein
MSRLGTVMGRRAFLGGMGMAGLGAAGLLASCGSAATQAAAACVGSLNLPVVQPDSRAGEVLSKVANVPAAWTKYPAPWKSWTADPPISSGQPVSVFEVLWGAPPAPVGQNQYWQELNKRLGAAWNVTPADANDYGTKLNALAASKSFADITYINFTGVVPSGGAFEKIVDEGAFHDLTPYLSGNALKDYPNLQRLPKISWSNGTFEGKIFGPPYPIPPVDTLWIYRKDWAEKLGVDNPTNAAELKKMFLAFANGNPNGSGNKDTWAFGAVDYPTLLSVFHAPNNWRLNKDGSLTSYIETDEFKAAMDFAAQLWKGGAYNPDAVTNTYNQNYPLIESGHVGFQYSAIVAEMGSGGLVSMTEQQVPGSNLTPIILPGESGGNAAPPLGSGAYGFYGIPTTVKSEKRIQELLRVLDWWAAPFGSEEFTFLEYGIENLMYKFVDGAPTPVSDTALTNLSSGLNYMCQPLEINFFYPGLPERALLSQQMSEKMIALSVADPTLGLYSPTNVEQGANLAQVILNAQNDILVGRQPLSSGISNMISTWKGQGGDQARTEYQKALAKCH